MAEISERAMREAFRRLGDFIALQPQSADRLRALESDVGEGMSLHDALDADQGRQSDDEATAAVERVRRFREAAEVSDDAMREFWRSIDGLDWPVSSRAEAMEIGAYMGLVLGLLARQFADEE